MMKRWMLVSLSLAATASAFAQSLQEQVLERVNVARWDNGQLPPLKGQSNLDQAANGHSQAMGVRNFFSHCDLDTLTSPWQRMTAAGYTGYSSAAENIDAGSSTAQGVMQEWMNSAGHRANILSTTVREIGIGYYRDNPDQGNVRFGSGPDGCIASAPNNGPYVHYWTQKFGRRDAVMPLVIAREAWQVSACSVDLYLYGSGWASQYRLSNDNQNWTPWQPFNANVLWALSGAAGGTATVYGQIRNSSGTVRSAQDSVRLSVTCGDQIFANGFQ